MAEAWSLRAAGREDVRAIRRFGEEHIPAHYAPLIGPGPADDQVRRWWDETQIAAAAGEGLLVLATEAGQIIGVGERGTWEGAHVVWKLYIHPDFRGRGLGPRLIDELIGGLPVDADQLFIEHFAANVRAGAFYEREGFAVDRIEPQADGDRARDTVWRVRDLRRRPAKSRETSESKA